MNKSVVFTKCILATAIAATIALTAGCHTDDAATVAPPSPPAEGTISAANYEIWASDQSNSAAGTAGAGTVGSWIWVWNSSDVYTQLGGGTAAEPLSCDGNNTFGGGPCDLNDIFPAALVEDAGADGTIQDQAVNADSAIGATGRTLGNSDVAIGRLHGMLPDPQNKYMNVNAFAAGAGYVGIMDARTKEGVALFRVSKTDGGRSVHMSFWNNDGSAILIANLHGRLLERIDVTRDASGNITGANLNRGASLSTQGVTVTDDATAFTGMNGQGNALLSSVSGTYNANALGAFTPNGNNKINLSDATAVPPVVDPLDAGRPSGVIICPIVADSGATYVTLAGGGAIIADSNTTPMRIIGEYSNADSDSGGSNGLNGVGCGGIQVNDTIWLNSGASASGAGATQSTFTMYNVDNTGFDTHIVNSTTAALNTPAPTLIFKDANNTDTGGHTGGTTGAADASGQIPGTSTRRDGHGMARTVTGGYIHNVDRVQNNVEVFSATGTGGMNAHIGTYDLTSADGQGNGDGACAMTSVTDGDPLLTNDPAPDLMGTTPDGNFLLVALRGPAPVTVSHSAQGSCPGVGIISMTNNGASGVLAAVLRTTNTVDNSTGTDIGTTGGITYNGAERSDPHGAIARSKVADGAGGYQ